MEERIRLRVWGITVISAFLIFGGVLSQNSCSIGNKNSEYIVYKKAPFEPVLPQSIPKMSEIKKEIKIFASPKEYESASLVINTRDRDLKGINIRVTDLIGKKGKISGKIVDVRIVKCWYQAGKAIRDVRHKILTPELLLKNDGLVQADIVKKVNVVGIFDTIKDSLFFQLFDVPKNSFKQIWLTFHIPLDSLPDEYEGKIEIIPQNVPKEEIKIRLVVLPIKLLPPMLEYSIYYRGKLRLGNYPPEVGSEWKNENQMQVELKDMLAHGIANPTVYQPFITRADGSYDFSILKQILEIRKRVGIVNKPLLYLGLGTGATQDKRVLDDLKKKVRALVTFARENGCPDVYIYGIDEAKGKRLKSERLAFHAVHEAGGKVFVACGSDFADLVGDLLDLPIYGGIPSASHIKKVHKFGYKIWNYGNPQCGVEEPLTYRRNYGLLLWQKGLDGTCDYAYQHAFGNIWDDFDHATYRDHVMAYPTIDGVIPTIQWEGFREGVDDVRYLTTLVKIIKKLEVKGKAKDEVKAARRLVAQLKRKNLKDLSALDLQEIRWEIVQMILELQKR